MSCCGVDADAPDSEQSKRETEALAHRASISRKKRDEILQGQDGLCAYCFYPIGGRIVNEKSQKAHILRCEIDHFIPWSFMATNKGELIASCQICNRVKMSDVYDDITSARVALRVKREILGWPNEFFSGA